MFGKLTPSMSYSIGTGLLSAPRNCYFGDHETSMGTCLSLTCVRIFPGGVNVKSSTCEDQRASYVRECVLECFCLPFFALHSAETSFDFYFALCVVF